MKMKITFTVQPIQETELVLIYILRKDTEIVDNKPINTYFFEERIVIHKDIWEGMKFLLLGGVYSDNELEVKIVDY